ncbi:hypothetical protein MTsPCn5_03920 [Croceitalea sp. MTPC5]|uniref:OB-fold protein n=1 Tax=Croceitalea sp. MTPC5 TaxID=3056565 RepID=UPI002B3AE09C|nr:hypothetical protein MTsPCn5_03920 [Croceitalea sp. MTPC5]
MIRHFSFLYRIVFGCFALSVISCKYATNQDISAIAPKMSYDAGNLIATLQTTKEYDSETVIAVTGIVHEVNTINNRVTILLKGNDEQENYIICDMDSNQTHKIKTIQKGDSLVIKGLLKGMLKDVIMLNCIIVKSE